MDIKELKENLSDNDIFTLLDEMGAKPKYDNKGNILSLTICHCGDSHKMYYYSESRTFHCYTHCGSFDVIELVQNVNQLDFYPALKWLANRFGMTLTNSNQMGDNSSMSEDLAILKRWKRKEANTIELPKVDPTVLDDYYDIYMQNWIDDGISIEAMMEFGIKVSISDQAIIIPHYDSEGNLIGIRKRNFNPKLVENGLKYVPLRVGRNFYNHPTGANLYGLNLNLRYIQTYKTLILVESEKAVMQIKSMFPNWSVAVCVSGSFLTNYQLEIIKKLGVEEVVIAMDKEFSQTGTLEEQNYAKKIKEGFVDKLMPYSKVSVIWDWLNLLEEKDSPTDKGIDIFKQLFINRIEMNHELQGAI